MPDPVSLPPRPSLVQLATRSALWAGFSQYIFFGLGFVKTILLSRLVGVEYFNLLAVAGVWASYLSFTRLDLRVAVLRHTEDSAVLNTQFWLETSSALLGLGIAFGVYTIVPGIVAQSYAWPVIFALMFMVLFEAATSTPMYLVEKRLRQDVLGKLTIFATLVNFIVPVVLALAGQQFVAVICDVILPTLIINSGVLLVIRWRPALIWSRQQAAEQIRLGWTLLSTGLMGKIIFQFDDWLVSTVNRPHLLPWLSAGGDVAEGFYSRAYTTGKMPMDVAAGVIGRIALSLYAESAARGRDVLVKAYSQLTWLLAWIIFASSAIAFVTADEVVSLLLTDRWLPMVPLFRLMFLFVVGRPLFQNNGQLLQAIRGENEFRRTVALQTVVILLSCPLAVYWWGAAGASVVVSLMTVFGVVASEWYVTRHLGVHVWKCYIVPLGACALTIGGSFMLVSGFSGNPWLSLFIKGVIGVVVFGLALLVFERQTARENWQLLRQGLKRE